MGFFARPRLSNEQFVQHTDDVLTLSGQTQIATTTGLALTGDTGYIPIQATGGSNNFVLTYDDTGATPVIKLKESSASGGTSNYPYVESATTTVGGLPAGQNLYNEQIVDILHDILVPTLAPTTYDELSNSLSLFPSLTNYEIGCSLSLTGTSSFNRGFVDPTYCGTCCYPAGLPTTHVFCPNWLPTPISAYTSSLSYSCPLFAVVTLITPGTNPFRSQVTYLSGDTPTYYSDGCVYSGATPAGTTACATKNLCGIYPWFWGKITCAVPAGNCRPSASCIKHEITGNTCQGLNTGNKVVAASTGTICTNFNGTVNDYLWFAAPAASCTKTCWYIDALNSGLIGGAVSPAGNLFPTPDTVTGVTTTCWSGQCYKVYVSNKQTPSTSIMQLRNS